MTAAHLCRHRPGGNCCFNYDYTGPVKTFVGAVQDK